MASHLQKASTSTSLSRTSPGPTPAAFAVTLESLGLFVAILLMTVFASLANREPRWGEAIVLLIA